MSRDLSTAEDQNGGQLAEEVQQRAQSLAEQARTRAREQVGQRSSDLASHASGVAEDLQAVAEHFRSQGRDAPANVAEQAAQRVSGAAQYLQTTDGERLLRDAEALGRERPWTAVASGVAVGLVASRFLKASSTQRYRMGASDSTSAPGRRNDAVAGREADRVRFDRPPQEQHAPISPVERR